MKRARSKTKLTKAGFIAVCALDNSERMLFIRLRDIKNIAMQSMGNLISVSTPSHRSVHALLTKWYDSSGNHTPNCIRPANPGYITTSCPLHRLKETHVWTIVLRDRSRYFVLPQDIPKIERLVNSDSSLPSPPSPMESIAASLQEFVHLLRYAPQFALDPEIQASKKHFEEETEK